MVKLRLREIDRLRFVGVGMLHVHVRVRVHEHLQGTSRFVLCRSGVPGVEIAKMR